LLDFYVPIRHNYGVLVNTILSKEIGNFLSAQAGFGENLVFFNMVG
jgi:hypothetical protein